MCVIFVDSDGNPVGPVSGDLPDKPGLMWVAPADAALPALGPGMPALSADYLDGGLVDIPALHDPDFRGGDFAIRCLETNRTVLDLHTKGGVRNLVVDVVDGISRIRHHLANVTIHGVDAPPVTPGEPAEWHLAAHVGAGDIATMTDTPRLA